MIMNRNIQVLALFCIVTNPILHFSDAFVHQSYRQISTILPSIQPKVTFLSKSKSADDDSKSTEKDIEVTMNPLAKASWYAVETFGKIFATTKEEEIMSDESYDLTKPPKSAQETLARIKLDNDRQYFLSGRVDKFIYDPDCIFSDPFVAFSGRDRFIDNLQNLGSFITKYDAKPLDYKVDENVVETKVMVKLELNLPWKPILAWPWGVRYEIDPETFLVKDHKESWDIGAIDGVKQIFRKPTLKI